ncbi:beta-2-glycoprotein 1-like [Mugil cephalus]|uniref:beta-2-glycoprotein 1-like n=1 Tax=Mugil cephalus TaxID=48193 RepID=UPI001FB7D8C6|nr:beta-2-glycoprotein 1-like [Mugil cephalus]
MEPVLTSLLLCPVLFLTTFAQENVCHRPELPDNVQVSGLQRYFSPGVELALSCKQGYTSALGPRTIVCTAKGEWTKTRFMCRPKHCPYPDMPPNGQLYYDDTIYQSTINYTCDEGYILTGSSMAVCQADGTWSTPAPECKPVTCGLAPIPEFGLIMYEKTVRGNTTDYGTIGTYACLPPHVIIGNARAECTASGTWTETPKCQVVTCPPPQNIERGYMASEVKRSYDYKESVKYGCLSDYILEGSMEVFCREDGHWSEKPSCNAACTVDIQRGRILYKGQKKWIEDFKPNKILHKELVSVYCKSKARNCGFAVSTQCIDGSLKIPDCFEEPSQMDYKFNSASLPSEIEQC